mmetsp:Transcript_25582/g.59264  ORF Transcript_25582/g.59264 Transcript_25582/m.59264 type:complete len:309 (+) Transcript_25582:557-1483(+)
MAEALASGAAPLAEERDSRVLAQLAPLLAPLAAFSYSSYARAAAGDKPSGKSPGCEVFVLARDGVELSAPRLQARVLVSPGSRAELLVRCSSAGIFDLRTDPPKVGFSDWTHIGTGSDIASGALMRLAVLADSAAGPPPARDALRYGAEASNGGSPGHAAGSSAPHSDAAGQSANSAAWGARGGADLPIRMVRHAGPGVQRGRGRISDRHTRRNRGVEADQRAHVKPRDAAPLRRPSSRHAAGRISPRRKPQLRSVCRRQPPLPHARESLPNRRNQRSGAFPAERSERRRHQRDSDRSGHCCHRLRGG